MPKMTRDEFAGTRGACARPAATARERKLGRGARTDLVVAGLVVAGLVTGAACAAPPERRAVETMQEAVAAASAKDYDRAAELAERASEERPGFVDPLFLLAAIRERTGRMDDARDTYSRILAFDPTATAAAVALAQTYVAEGRRDEAADWLRRAIEEDPGAEAAAFNLGSLAEGRGAGDEAAAWFQLAGTLDRRDPRAPTHIARIRFEQGRPDDARRAAEEAVRRAPDYAPAQRVLAAIPPTAPAGSTAPR